MPGVPTHPRGALCGRCFQPFLNGKQEIFGEGNKQVGGMKVFPKEFPFQCATIRDTGFGNTGKLLGDSIIISPGPHFSLENPSLLSIKISFSLLSQLEVLDGSGFLVLLEWEGYAALRRSNGPVALPKPSGGDSSVISFQDCLPFLLITVGSILGAKPALESHFLAGKH